MLVPHIKKNCLTYITISPWKEWLLVHIYRTVHLAPGSSCGSTNWDASSPVTNLPTIRHGLSSTQCLGRCRFFGFLSQGLVNVPIEHHPTVEDIISNRYLKVMRNQSPKTGHQSQPCQWIKWVRCHTLLYRIMTGWWFGCHQFGIFPYIGLLIIPID